MCLAVPGKVISIDGENATIDYGRITKIANISLMEDIAENDFVIVHAGFAIQKVEKEHANIALRSIIDNIK